jgi:hypothetical protein
MPDYEIHCTADPTKVYPIGPNIPNKDDALYIIKNPRSKLRGNGGRKEAYQKNAASCGEYVPKEIQPHRLGDQGHWPFYLRRLHPTN